MGRHLLPLIYALLVCTVQHLTGLDHVLSNLGAHARTVQR